MCITRVGMLGLCILLAGCTTTSNDGTATAPVGDGPAAFVNQWVGALQSQNVDAVMEHFSDRYTNLEIGDKNGARATVEQARVMGYLQDITADISRMKCTRQGDGCIAGPVKLAGNFGNYTLNLHLAEESGAWKIVGSEELENNTLAQVTQ